MKKHHKFLTITIYLFLIAIICAISFIYYFSTQLGNGLIECAEEEIRHLTTLVMNYSVSKYNNTTKNTKFIKIEKNNNQVIERIEYDTKILNQTKDQILDLLETNIDYMVKGHIEKIGLNPNKLSNEYYEQTSEGIIFTISIGNATNNFLLANIGPKIPIILKPVGNVTATINTNLKEYGLNNALIEINIELTSTILIRMPFLSKKVTTKNTIPLSKEIIQGNIPNSYLNYKITP